MPFGAITRWLCSTDVKEIIEPVVEKEDSKAAFIIGDESDGSENGDDSPGSAPRLVETVSVETQTMGDEEAQEVTVVHRTLDECVATLRSEVCCQNYLNLCYKTFLIRSN